MQEVLMLALAFTCISSVLSHVSVLPLGQAVAALGGDTSFTCFSSFQIETVEWLINGTSLNDLQLSGVTQEHTVTLLFRNVLAEYNNTRIQAIANGVPSSESSTLLVQGLLPAVGSLLVDAHVDHIYVSWTAPFTLDILTESVDITYCVDLVSSTSSATLHSECGINVTEFTYPLPPRSWCHEFNATVTPVNVVGHGTSKSKYFYQELIGPEVIRAEIANTAFSLLMSAPVCHADLAFLDSDAGGIITVEDSELIIAGNTITFNSQLLTTNRKYRIRVSASNIRDSATSETTISTYDVISSSIYQEESDIIILVNFTEHSEATGALLNYIFINDDGLTIDFRKSFSQTIKKSSVSQGLILPLNNFYSGRYMLYVYDIESDKLILNGLQYQASESSITIINGQEKYIPLPLGLITSKDRVITVVFPFSRFQVTAKLNALGSVNILHVNVSMDPQTPATLQVPENGEYLVTVLPIQDGRGILSGVAFSQIHTVTDAFTITTQGPTNLMPTTSTNFPSQPESTIIGLVGGLVCFALLSAVLTVAVVIQSCKLRQEKVRVHLNPPPEVDSNILAETQLYEEIKEPASVTPIQTPANPAPRVPAPALVPQYEDVETSNTKDSSYQITMCAAYGVHFNNN